MSDSFNPAQFIREVRQEANKISWPTRRETLISALMVLVLVSLTAVFFVVVDGILAWGIQKILGFGG